MKLKTAIKAVLIAGTVGIALTAAGCGGNKSDSAKGASGNGWQKNRKGGTHTALFPL